MIMNIIPLTHESLSEKPVVINCSIKTHPTVADLINFCDIIIRFYAEPVISEQNIKFWHIYSFRAPENVPPATACQSYTFDCIKCCLSPNINGLCWAKNTTRTSVSKCPSSCDSVLSLRIGPTPTCHIICPPASITSTFNPNNVIYTTHYACIRSTKIYIGVSRGPRCICE